MIFPGKLAHRKSSMAVAKNSPTVPVKINATSSLSPVVNWTPSPRHNRKPQAVDTENTREVVSGEELKDEGCRSVGNTAALPQGPLQPAGGSHRSRWEQGARRAVLRTGG